MKNIDYPEILKRAWRTTWENKFLWWFGFLIVLSGGSSFNYFFDQKDWNKMQETGAGQSISNFFTDHISFMIVAAIILLLLLLALAVIAIIARAGLIKSIQQIDRGEPAAFRTGFLQGKKYFWRVFMLELITGIFILCLATVLAVPIVFLFYNKNYIIGSILALLGFLIFIPALAVAFFTKTFAVLYSVTSNLNIRDAIEKGYFLFLKNIAASFVQSLIFLVLGIIFSFGVLLAFIFIALIFLMIGGLLYLLFQKTGLAVAAGFGFAFFLALWLFSRSIYETFIQGIWFFFFKEIAGSKAEEKIAEKILEIKTAPAPDPAG